MALIVYRVRFVERSTRCGPVAKSLHANTPVDPECRSSTLDSGKTRSAAYRCSQTQPSTVEPALVYVAWALTTLFLRSSGHFNTDPACRAGVLVRRLRIIGVSDHGGRAVLVTVAGDGTLSTVAPSNW